MKIRCNRIYNIRALEYLSTKKQYDVKLKLDGVVIIQDDTGEDIAVKIKNCNHINSDWEIIEKSEYYHIKKVSNLNQFLKIINDFFSKSFLYYFLFNLLSFIIIINFFNNEQNKYKITEELEKYSEPIMTLLFNENFNLIILKKLENYDSSQIFFFLNLFVCNLFSIMFIYLILMILYLYKNFKFKKHSLK